MCAGQEPAASGGASEPPATVLVLHDGGVLMGSVSRSGDRYVVARAGSEIQVPATNVLVVCRSLEEAYKLRREKLGRPDAHAHLLLAEWCLRHNLTSQAARELSDARDLDPRHPRLALLDRRLAAANQPRPQAHRPASSSAAGLEITTPAPISTNVSTRIDELPDGALERFTRKVQPILVNSCTLSGCHHRGGPQKFQLDRGLLHGLANRRSTMHNLTATLALVDRERPQLSPLLTVPRQTHGDMQGPVFGPRHEAAFTHLVDWVALISSSQANGEEKVRADDAVKLIAHDEVSLRSVSETDSTVQSNAAPARPDEPTALAPPARLRYGAQLQSWQPKDPFDSEIFNRAQKSQSKAGEAAQPNAEAASDGVE